MSLPSEITFYRHQKIFLVSRYGNGKYTLHLLFLPLFRFSMHIFFLLLSIFRYLSLFFVSHFPPFSLYPPPKFSPSYIDSYCLTPPPPPGCLYYKKPCFWHNWWEEGGKGIKWAWRVVELHPCCAQAVPFAVPPLAIFSELQFSDNKPKSKFVSHLFRQTGLLHESSAYALASY